VLRIKVRDAETAARGRIGSYAFVGVRQMSSLADHPASGPDRDPSVAAHVEQLYRSHAALVHSVCRSILRDRVEAEDAAQQTFLSAQRALMNGSWPQDAAAWLATIARNESLARVQGRMREPLAVELDQQHGAAPDVHATVSQRYEASELRDALGQLPGPQREAILLREVRGLSSPEVAAALSVTTHAAESLVFRARRRLRTQLQGAFAGLSPGLFVQPLRKLAASATTGGLAAPAAAKLAAVGVGAMLVTGGALVGPRGLGLGHGLQPFRSAADAPTHSAHPKGSLHFSPNLTPQSLHNRAVLDSDRARPANDSDSIRRAAVGQSSSDISGTSVAGDQGSAANQDAGSNGNAQQESSGSANAPQGSSSDAGSTDSGSGNSQGGGNSGDSQSGTTPGDSGQGD
jgi:RNA polymerase sigma-70 factor (ECF subfamily)